MDIQKLIDEISSNTKIKLFIDRKTRVLNSHKKAIAEAAVVFGYPKNVIELAYS